jgi:endonuclease III
MIDPENITNYNLNTYELEEHIMFWVLAAGKNGRTAARSLYKLIDTTAGYFWGPLSAINRASNLYDLPNIMKRCGIGCYNNKSRTLVELFNANLNLRTCSAEDLEKIHGIGMKTSRCFIIHSRKGAKYAGLDTHMLKHLRAVGVENVPKSTPTSKKEYLRLEKEVLRLADEVGMSPADFDLVTWRKYSVNSGSRKRR